MARPGLEKSAVKQASDALRAQGVYPSVDAVRAALGNTGSKSTIHKYLKELEQDAGKPTGPRAATATTIARLVDSLAGELHQQAEQRIADLRAAHAAELDLLHQQIARLSRQLQQAQAAASLPAWAHGLDFHPADGARAEPAGFGVFGDLISNARGGAAGLSRFDELFNSRSAPHHDDDELWCALGEPRLAAR